MKNLLLITALLLSTSLAAEPACPRIISQSPYITKTLQWLDLESCIVGVSRYDKLERPHTGGVLDPDGEVIATLEPDLLFTSDWTPVERLAAITPEGTRSFRLGGFASMAEIEVNLRLIGHETRIRNIEARGTDFHRQWTNLAAQINGNNKKVLLLSACSGTPYSFGQKRWLSELFSHAGFINVETAEKIRHIRPGEELATLSTLINELEPELLFIFERKQNKQCAFIKPKTPLTIINLDGDKFLHPAPTLLQGLRELAQHKGQWQNDEQ
ncbi:MAG: ABC transporter substrate-binding protein [Gammaproteobacteria bacterium]|nr:ABC transporter substrate-binding protein [Gammaproteobacteria bacterium]MCW8958855.1 ABC transporter substrate-binding protein [Gammaproteobacteria bacterium]MCW8971662.1 ABC transporter substrate-binding protein [Gammaproteobacteria bacterium]MCW8993433.1 ABC transporter substrate-binding protein [Gammaproteobacteria bacterium]